MSDETIEPEDPRAGRFAGHFQMLLDRIQHDGRRRELDKPPYNATRLRLRLNLEHAIPLADEKHVYEVIATHMEATIVVADDALPKTLAKLRHLLSAEAHKWSSDL